MAHTLGSDDHLLGILRLAIVAALVAMHLILLLRSREGRRHRPRALVLQEQRTLRHAEVPHFSPILAPRVPYDPEEAVLRIGSPANH